MPVDDAELHVRRRLPGAFCLGRLNPEIGQTIFTVSTSSAAVIATGRSVAEAWQNAAVIMSTAPDEADHGAITGRDVQELIGGQLQQRGQR